MAPFELAYKAVSELHGPFAASGDAEKVPKRSVCV